MFLSVCINFYGCVSQCLYELLHLCFLVFVWTLRSLPLRFSVFVRSLLLTLAFLSVYMDSCTWAFVSQYRMDSCARFSVLVFFSVCMNSCACVCQFLYGISCLHFRFVVFVWTFVLALVLLNVCMDSRTSAFVCQCLYELLCFCFSVFV